jgi:hypothetical protein
MERIKFVNVMGQPDQVTVMATDTVSDGYHTFGELYDHRITLWIALCRKRMEDTDTNFGTPNYSDVWRSKEHNEDDQEMYDGWFILGIGKEPGKQITYHLPLSRWDECYFAETLEHAPKFDGHTPQDTLERLKKL